MAGESGVGSGERGIRAGKLPYLEFGLEMDKCRQRGSRCLESAAPVGG